MTTAFEPIIKGVLGLVKEWEPKLIALNENLHNKHTNKQNRTIKQIVGHMVDSATNNTHRMVHLQYQNSPFEFPNYATNGNNDRWIAIQNYQNEDWYNLVQLWKYSNIHVTHVINHVNINKLKNEWITGEESNCSLNNMIVDYLRHLELHLNQIEELIK